MVELMEQIELRTDSTVELVQSIGNDETVVAAARVSTLGTEAQRFMDVPAAESAGLINFLVKNRHGSPFEHNSMTFRIEAPIFVWREFMRHRIGWSYNELSGRYSELKPVFYIPGEDRPIVQEGKPGAYSFVDASPYTHGLTCADLSDAYECAWETYKTILASGVAREVARMCLPVGIFSTAYATCNARSLLHFLSLRTEAREGDFFPSYPQYEIARVADKMEEIFADLFPITYKAFCENGRAGG